MSQMPYSVINETPSFFIVAYMWLHMVTNKVAHYHTAGLDLVQTNPERQFIAVAVLLLIAFYTMRFIKRLRAF